MRAVKRVARVGVTLGVVAALVLVAGVVVNATVSAVTRTNRPHAMTPDPSLVTKGRQIFRYDTFGDQAFWGGALQLHRAVEGAKNGGVGSGVSPKTALSVGLKVDAAKIVNKVLASWGAGKFDATLLMDGKGFRPDGKTAATLIPPAFGLAGINLHTFTGWGSVTHWNAFVANLEMHGKGIFFDPRLNDAAQFPVAAAAGFGNVRNDPDLITSKLASLHFYQLAIPAPKAPSGSFDPRAAARGEVIFNGKAECATCHVPPLFTEPGWSLHTPDEIGIDDFQANRSPDKRYRTSPLKALWTHQKGGFFHDGRFATLREVVDHYNSFFGLGLGEGELNDLVEYLKSL